MTKAIGYMCCLWVAQATWVCAQESPNTRTPSAKPAAQTVPTVEDLKKLEDRIMRLEIELARSRSKNTSTSVIDPKSQKVLVLLETPHLGHVYTGGPNGSRFFAGKMLAVNLSPQPVTIKRDDVKLIIDGQPQLPKDVPQSIRYQGFQQGRQHVQLESVNSFKELRIGAGGTNSGWVFVPDLPAGGRVPKITLEVSLGQTKETVDINAQQRGLLGLEVQYIGPKESLALYTVSGELNMINLGVLVDELDLLAARKIGRTVVSFSDAASISTVEIQSWLAQVARSLGQAEFNNEQFPPLPAGIREFHLANLPRPRESEVGEGVALDGEMGPIARIHKTEAEAVMSALKTACEALPREELMAGIEQGHVYARAAVIAYGAGRLPADKLPLILKLADDPNPDLQKAALIGLRHFGEAEAINKLLTYVRKNIPVLSPAAVASLAGSRFPAANDALLELLRAEPPESKKSIVKVLAQFPRPIWSEALLEFAKSPESGLNLEAIRALNKVGHAQLTTILKEGLASTDEALRTLSFEILVDRKDRESEEAALTYTLEWLKTSLPTPLMTGLINRVKDPRVVPLLLQHLQSSDEKDVVLESLLQIGDQTLLEKLLPLYDTMRGSTRARLLTAFRKWDTEKFRELAKTALMTADASLVMAAVQGLVEDASPAAVGMLAEAFEKNPETQVWPYISNALGQLATDQARAALTKAREGKDRAKRSLAIQGLALIRQRSPGIQHVYQGTQEMQEKNYDKAVEHFSQAIERDPRLPEAYVGRGDSHNRLGKFAEARKDYQKAWELDPYNAQAMTGAAIMQIIAGEMLEGVALLESNREKFREEPLFLYNAACVYGRAVEHLDKHPDTKDRDTLIAKFKKLAVDDLTRSVKAGFQDIDWMAKDPDLIPLKNEAGFQLLLKKKGDDSGASVPSGEAVNSEDDLDTSKG